jgi:M6 family metalloprotease-like protein
MKRGLATIIAVGFFVVPFSGLAQVYPPKPGVELPEHMVERMRSDRNTFQFERAWIQKVERIKNNREAYIEDRGFYYRPLLSSEQVAEMAVTGTVSVPVFCAKYANTGTDPYATALLDQKLFTGPFSPQTLSQFYNEISYGLVTMTGAVYGWHTLSQNDTYYEGPAGCYGTCSGGNVGQFIVEVLNAYDGTVDFGLFDNDGPDNIPNSGDDDGYVDFAAFVQPEVGAECNPSNNNIWSHRWALRWAPGSGGTPWTSNDPSASGGYVKVNDYVMQPAWNCGGTTVIDIGVFCHEFGHAFGLPDLYDTDRGSAGVGHWCLMGSGSWNTVTQPSHMSAWCKNELGWVNLIEMGSNPTTYNVNNIEFLQDVYRANVMDERWRRESSGCTISGGYSMRCGLTSPEAGARGWNGGEGYGNGWVERVSHEFHYDGSGGPVWFDYDYRYDSESNYDYTYARIDVGGAVNTLATYHGSGSGSEHIDVSPYFSIGVPVDYTVYFEFESDYGASDEDYGYSGCGFCSYQSTCGPFVFDNVAVNGGGEIYFTDFELREDGWWCDMTDPSECFFIENRQPLGSDANVHGGGGLCIWHVDQDVAHSLCGNTGASSSAPGVVPRGVALVQSDASNHLEWNTNRGDANDAYPGGTGNAALGGATNPASNSYNGWPTNVSVQLSTANGDPITIQGSGSWHPPTYASSFPPNEFNDKTVWIQIYGAGMQHGCTVDLISGATVINAPDVEWVGKDFVVAEVDISGAVPGPYDIVLTNPGGGSFVASAAFQIDPATGVEAIPVPGEFALRQNYPNPFNPTTTIPFDIKESTHVTVKIYDPRGRVVRTLVDENLGARSYGIEWNGRNDAGHTVSSGVYFYQLIAGDFKDVRKLVLTK